MSIWWPSFKSSGAGDQEQACSLRSAMPVSLEGNVKLDSRSHAVDADLER